MAVSGIAGVYEGDISKIRDAVAVSGITGVTVDTTTVQRLSARRVSVQLDYDGTDFDTDSSLTFTIISEAIANHNGNKLTTEITCHRNRRSCCCISGITIDRGDAGWGALLPCPLRVQFMSRTFPKSEMRWRYPVSGVTVDTTTVQRLSARRVSVQLDYDGTDFDTDLH